ncbi:MAG TPA: M23 family metallopeptidase [Prolixibacteraceae bacterium]|nr:M23 family metallopeptidase [Prolixibacteraceae bacterium]
MAKKKYRFNPESLSYEEHGVSLKERLTRFMAYFSSSLAFSIVLTIVILNLYESPASKVIKRENQRLLTQYRLMQKDLATVEKVLEELQQRDDNIYRVIFETDPIPSSVRKAGFGGSNKYGHLESMDNSDLVINTAKKLDILAKEAYIQSKSYDEVYQLALQKEKMLASIPSIQPVYNKDLKKTGSGWGYRIHPIYKIRKFHYGIDFTASTGTEIYATGDGTVKEVTTEHSGYGKMILVDHGFGYKTLYGHLSNFKVKPGQKVKRGEIIGFVGNTGTSTHPHLHYEVHKGGEPVNPQFYFYMDLTPQEYERMIALSSNMGQSFD